MPNHKLSENVYLENICVVVKCIMMTQTNFTILLYDDAHGSVDDDRFQQMMSHCNVRAGSFFRTLT